MNYLYFIPKTTNYIGIGTRTRLDLNKNYFTPFEFNPNLIFGLTTEICNKRSFVELKCNFLKIIKLLSDYSEIYYESSYKKEVLKKIDFSVNLGLCF